MRAETEALLTKARRSLDNARRSLDAGDADFAASRAYYAMFYAAEALLLSRGLAFSKHAAVIAEFTREFVRSVQARTPGRSPAGREDRRPLTHAQPGAMVGSTPSGSSPDRRAMCAEEGNGLEGTYRHGAGGRDPGPGWLQHGAREP